MTYRQVLYTISVLALPSAALALDSKVEFICEWQVSTKPYQVRILIDLEKKVATRSDGGIEYTLLKFANDSVFLGLNTRLAGFAFQSIERSPVGGVWSDQFALASGELLQNTGGYCVEKPSD